MIDHAVSFPAVAPAVRPDASRSAERNTALDFTKGALVICMIVYHSLNYFHYDLHLLRHLHFLPPSFIFIVGFLVTHVYAARIRSGDHGAARRLCVRGLKLLVLFIALNLIVHAAFDRSFNRALGFAVLRDEFATIFFAGYQRAVVFAVLLPISYVLLVSAALLRLAANARGWLVAVTGVMCLICWWLERTRQLPFNLDLVSIGLVGMVAGYVSRARMDQLARPVLLWMLAYALYSVAVEYRYPAYLMNTVGVGLALLLCYSIGLQLAGGGRTGRTVARLGTYSLFAYLAQIAVLQALARMAARLGFDPAGATLPMLVTLVLTLAAVQALDALRRQARFVDGIYQAVFA